MEILSLKLLDPIKSSVRWLYLLVTDQTKIEVAGQCSSTQPPRALLVQTNKKGDGLLLFGITTKSRRPVELTKLTIDYSTPLQLKNPDGVAYFTMASSNDETFPFRLCWEGSIELQNKHIHAFALTTRIPTISQLPIRITTHARVHNSYIGGFVGNGRMQVSSSVYRIISTGEILSGLEIPPKFSLTSSQPFLIQSAATASNNSNSTSSVLIHEQFADGTASSKIIDILGTK